MRRVTTSHPRSTTWEPLIRDGALRPADIRSLPPELYPCHQHHAATERSKSFDPQANASLSLWIYLWMHLDLPCFWIGPIYPICFYRPYKDYHLPWSTVLSKSQHCIKKNHANDPPPQRASQSTWKRNSYTRIENNKLEPVCAPTSTRTLTCRRAQPTYAIILTFVLLWLGKSPLLQRNRARPCASSNSFFPGRY